MVAGIIAADINGDLIDGVCKNVSIVPIKIAKNDANTTTNQTIINALTYCENNGIKIVNISYDIFELNSIKVAEAIRNFDGLVIIAAGNISMEYPIEDLDLAAPHVTAAAALIMSHATHYTPAQVKQLLMNTVDTGLVYANKCKSGGRLNINQAVDWLFTENRGAYTKGDVNGDGYVNTLDGNLIVDYLSGIVVFSNEQINAADVDGYAGVSASDMITINKYFQKQIYFIP